MRDFRRSASASLTVTNLHTGVNAYADASDRAAANQGLRSPDEKLAKYLKRKMMDDERNFRPRAIFSTLTRSLPLPVLYRTWLLRLLRDIKSNLNLQRIPLAWKSPPAEDLSAIEVYPAATLIGHGFRSGGYKKADQSAQRNEIIGNLRSVAEFSDRVPDAMLGSADVLDAVVCLVAAHDFLLGRAMGPEDRALAEVEGWIWTREKQLP